LNGLPPGKPAVLGGDCLTQVKFETALTCDKKSFLACCQIEIKKKSGNTAGAVRESNGSTVLAAPVAETLRVVACLQQMLSCQDGFVQIELVLGLGEKVQAGQTPSCDSVEHIGRVNEQWVIKG